MGRMLYGRFKEKPFKKDIILVAVGYYFRVSLNYRNVSEILKEQGVSVQPITIVGRICSRYIID